MGNIRSNPIPLLAFVRLEGAWVTAAGVEDQPAVVATGTVVADVSPVAKAAGLRPGIRVQSARRLLNGLVVVTRDAIDPLAALEPLYEALLSLSPRVEPVVDHLAAFCELDPGQAVDDVVAVLQAAGLGRHGHRLVLGIGHGRLVARMAARVAARSRAGGTGGRTGSPGQRAGGTGTFLSRAGGTGARAGTSLPRAGTPPLLAGSPLPQAGIPGRRAGRAAKATPRLDEPARSPDARRGGQVGGRPVLARQDEAPGARGLAVVSCRVPPGQEAAFLAPMPVTALQEEVPPAARRQLQRLGLFTLGDVTAAPRQVVARAVGDLAPLLQAWCRGDDRRPLDPGFPPPGITATLVAPPELADDLRPGWWPAQLPRLAREAAAQLVAAGRAGRLVILQGERSRVGRYLPVAVTGQDVLARAALDLYRRLLPVEPAPARLALTVTALEPVARQLALAGLDRQDPPAPAPTENRNRQTPVTGEPLPAGNGRTPLASTAGPGRGPAGSSRGRANPGRRRADFGSWRADPGPGGREVAGPELPFLLDELSRRYPGRIFWGRERPVTWRERQLAYWDPWRGAPGGPGA